MVLSPRGWFQRAACGQWCGDFGTQFRHLLGVGRGALLRVRVRVRVSNEVFLLYNRHSCFMVLVPIPPTCSRGRTVLFACKLEIFVRAWVKKAEKGPPEGISRWLVMMEKESLGVHLHAPCRDYMEGFCAIRTSPGFETVVQSSFAYGPAHRCFIVASLFATHMPVVGRSCAAWSRVLSNDYLSKDRAS